MLKLLRGAKTSCRDGGGFLIMSHNSDIIRNLLNLCPRRNINKKSFNVLIKYLIL